MTTSCTSCGRQNPQGANFCESCGLPLHGEQVENDALIGRVLGGRFRVVSLVGEGGMGRVYLALDQCGGREVAVKTLKPEFFALSKVRTRFRLEAENLFNVSHPGVVEFLGYLEEDQPLLFMEFIRGRTLRKIVEDEGPIDPMRAVSISSQVLEGLYYLHTLPVPMIHRDVKPDNISFLPDGSVKLIDFGIAKSSQQIKITQAGAQIGTYEYMSPEQVAGDKELTAAVDQYAFGVTLYFMVAGRVPFEQTTELGLEVLQAHKSEEPPWPSALNRRIPSFLRDGILKSLEKDPANRFPSCFHFKRYLESQGGQGGLS